MKPPTDLRRSRLAASPVAAWPLVAHSRFLADYLGVQLPEAALELATTLHGRDRDGSALTVQVLAAEPPAGLSLILRGSTGTQALHLALAAREGGSQLTITHESLSSDEVGPAGADPEGAREGIREAAHGKAQARVDGPAGVDSKARPDAPAPAHAAASALATLLAAPLPAALQAAAVSDAHALAAARAFLADTTRAIDLLRSLMPPALAYQQPAPGRFSLAAHIWHLADIEELGWSQRLQRALTEDAPVLDGIDGDRLAIERRYQQRPWRAAAQRFVRHRGRSLQAVARFQTETLARPLHFGGAWISAGELLAAMLAHDHEHRLDMAALWPAAEVHADAMAIHSHGPHIDAHPED